MKKNENVLFWVLIVFFFLILFGVGTGCGYGVSYMRDQFKFPPSCNYLSKNKYSIGSKLPMGLVNCHGACKDNGSAMHGYCLKHISDGEKCPENTRKQDGLQWLKSTTYGESPCYYGVHPPSGKKWCVPNDTPAVNESQKCNLLVDWQGSLSPSPYPNMHSTDISPLITRKDQKDSVPLVAR